MFNLDVFCPGTCEVSVYFFSNFQSTCTFLYACHTNRMLVFFLRNAHFVSGNWIQLEQVFIQQSI